MSALSSLRLLAAVSAVLAYLQATLGGIVRVTGSGEGCHGWPLCSGNAYPTFDVHTIIEFSHRTNGTLLGLAVLATFLVVLIRFRHERRLLTLASVALALVVFEGAVGGTVVLAELQGFLVLFHFGVALIIVAVLLALALGVSPNAGGDGVPDESFRRLLVVATALTFVLLLTGSSVVATDAEEKCFAWPLCGNGFAVNLGGVIALNYLHRGAVLLLGALILHVTTASWRRWRDVPGVGTVGLLTAAAFLLQVADGALLALTHDVGLFSGLHVAMATAVWAGMAALTILAYRGVVTTRPAGALFLQGTPT